MPKFVHRLNPSRGFAVWKGAILYLAIFFLTSATDSTSISLSPQIERRFVANGFQTSGERQVDTIVLHSSYNSRSNDWYSLPDILDIFRQERVAAHYLIDRNGRIYQLVREQDIAHHAGISRWRGRSNINRFSLGIELVNHLDDRYTEAQYQALDVLLRDIERRHPIRFLLAHGEIAPERRSDPWNFDWSRVARFRTS